MSAPLPPLILTTIEVDGKKIIRVNTIGEVEEQAVKVYPTGMPLGLFKKVGNYRWTGGLGAEPPAGSRGSALVGVQGEAPLKLELFLNQNCPESHQLTRMVVTHVYNTCTGERKKKKRKKKGKKKSRKVWKSRNSDKSRKNGIPDPRIKSLIRERVLVYKPILDTYVDDEEHECVQNYEM